MADTTNASIISKFRERISVKPFVPATIYGRATLGAKGVPNKLFIAFLFSDHDVGVQFSKDVGLIPRVWCAVSADCKVAFITFITIFSFR
jgi:hypothetical protein